MTPGCELRLITAMTFKRRSNPFGAALRAKSQSRHRLGVVRLPTASISPLGEPSFGAALGLQRETVEYYPAASGLVGLRPKRS